MDIRKVIWIGTFALFTIGGCKKEPKIIETTTIVPTTENSKIFEDIGVGPNSSEQGEDVHKVTINEVLPTEKYVYLNVTEGEEKFWIATGKKEVKVGESYFYRGGLLKTNFESKEYNRIFDKVYLVAEIMPSSHGMHSIDGNQADIGDGNPSVNNPLPKSNQKSLKIAELVKNKTKYGDQFIQLSGECTKINPSIMGRNWIHLKDGSKDDYDLVVTSNETIAVGQFVTMIGKVALDKDFGAGYTYDIIVEDCQVVQ